GHVLQPIFEPIGFNWQIVISLIPAMAAREVIIAALGTVYAISGADDDAISQGLTGLITTGDFAWSFATGISLLVWFIYAPHCLSTLATVKRETQSWKITGVMTVYLFGLAYLMAFLAYQITAALTA
ncbi:MAG: nucleoside recognition domain-containing protein, partial [Acinetobacter sp.]|nr:nucleoside recognition domain-containing protein [Acinetobacter sp.]